MGGGLRPAEELSRTWPGSCRALAAALRLVPNPGRSETEFRDPPPRPACAVDTAVVPGGPGYQEALKVEHPHLPARCRVTGSLLGQRQSLKAPLRRERPLSSGRRARGPARGSIRSGRKHGHEYRTRPGVGQARRGTGLIIVPEAEPEGTFRKAHVF